jgi:long-chain fatty acid transport protein
MKTSRYLAAPALAVTALATSGTASAGGISVARFAGERGHAATDHVSAIYYNPAGLALAGGTNVYVEGLFAYRMVDYDRDPGAIDAVDPEDGTPPDGVAANSGKAELRNAIASPFFAASSDFGLKGFAAGIGFYVPFGGQAEWGKVDAYGPDGDPALRERFPGAYDGPQRWSAIEGQQRSIYYTAALAYAPHPRFSIGATFSRVDSTILLVRARNLSGRDDMVIGGRISEGRSLLDVEGTSYTVSVGATALVTPCFRVGISYLGQPGFGETGNDGTLTNEFGAGGESEPLTVELRQELPDSVKIGTEWNAFHRGSLRFSGEYTRWSVNENQCLLSGAAGGKCSFNADGSEAADSGDVILNIPRDWNDSFALRAGGSWWPTDALELNLGLTFDSNAIPDETLEPALIDAHKVISTVGLVYDVGPVSIEGTIGNVYYFKRETDIRPEAEDPLPPSRNPDMAGTYEQLVTYVGLGVGVHL